MVVVSIATSRIAKQLSNLKTLITFWWIWFHDCCAHSVSAAKVAAVVVSLRKGLPIVDSISADALLYHNHGPLLEVCVGTVEGTIPLGLCCACAGLLSTSRCYTSRYKTKRWTRREVCLIRHSIACATLAHGWSMLQLLF